MQRTRPVSPQAERRATPASLRDRLAMLLALITIVCLGAAFFLSRDTQFLMPGPLASVHGAIGNCSACHTKSGGGKLSWIHGLVAGDSRADSKACLTCHKMPNTAFNAHSASGEVLKQSTKRLTKIAAASPAPSRMRTVAFPTDDVVARGLNCATCHQEHQGVSFSLNKIANDRCHSCHVVKFDSFDGHHPKFERYPFKRRTRIIYDHAGHFDKHFPEIADKYPARRIPDDCSTCHDSRKDERVMAVAPFEQTCSTCHLDQIIGKERASGPKGIAFLTLPGLDLQTLRKRNASIGEWPDASEAELTPFMKVMIGRDERGRALIKTADRLNLQDLADANDDEIKAVTNLIWEIKRLFYRLISGKASDILADLDIGGGAKLSSNLFAELTASLPRDVIISAQQQWLPNLAAEVTHGPSTSDPEQAGWSTAIAAAEPPPESADSDTSQPVASPPAEVSKPRVAKLDPPVCVASVLGQCLLFKTRRDETEAAKAETAQPGTAGEANDTADADTAPEETEAADAPSEAEASPPVGALADHAIVAATNDAETATEPDGTVEKTDTSNVDGGKEILSADEHPPQKTADQTDDLLFPTEAERRAIEAHLKHAEHAAQPSETTGNVTDFVAAEPQSDAALVVGIDSDVDSESWAEYGGWYRQDYAILYRPTGHKDKFIYSWLLLTGPRAPEGDASPAAAVFELLTRKDAQGSCTKCHSVDDLQRKRRLVNFSPASVESKQGRFTNFVHQPHFQAVGIGQRIGILENRGCLTCHVLEKGRSYLKSYEQGNPQNFASNFGAVNKELCQTCHTSSTARQDCLLCHKYHVNGVNTPTMTTKISTPPQDKEPKGHRPNSAPAPEGP